MSKPRKGQNEAADALRYGSKSGTVPTHDAMDNGPDEDDPDPNGDWEDEDWDAYDQRN